MARIHRNGNMLIRLDSIVAVSSDMDKPKELAIFTNSPGIFKIHFEKDEEVTKYIDDLQTRIEKELPDSTTMSKKEKTNKDLTSKIIRSTFSRGEGHGKQDMLDAACDYLESIEIDVYFNANKEKPDFDYERFVNDFRTSLTNKLHPSNTP